MEDWKRAARQVNKDNADRETIYKTTILCFDLKKKELEEEKKRDKDALEAMKSRYENSDPRVSDS